MSDAKVAIVTGAGSGVGRAAARQFASEGYSVVLVGRTLTKLEETRAMIACEQPGARLLVLLVDLLDVAATRAIPARVVEAFGRIDVLANIAGQAPVTTIETITEESFRLCMDANLTSTVQLTSACWPYFIKQKSGVVVNVSSMASFDPFPGLSMYAAAKAGVNLFTFSTGAEGRAHGIMAYCVAPGAIETPMLRGIWDEKAIAPEKTLDPKKVASVIVDLAQGRGDLASGQTMKLPSP